MERAKSPGFTLVEIAVVLFILALVTAGGIGLASSLRTAASQKSSVQNAEIIKTALQNFISRYGRLPCPAIVANTPAAATFGVEALTPGTCTGTIIDLGTGTAASGVVPWKTLGLAFDSALDGWGNQYTYVVTRAATNLNAQTLAGMRGVLTVHSDVPVVNGLPATGNQINACSTTAGDNGCNSFAVVVLISHGANLLGARTREGVATPVATSGRETENTDADLAFVSREPSSIAASEFDDVVVPLTPNDLLSALYAQGLKSEQSALNDKYRQIVSSLASLAVAGRAGGAGAWNYPIPVPIIVGAPVAGALLTYPFDGTKFADCAATPTEAGSLPASLQGVLDPWGRPFAYQISEAAMVSGELCAHPIVLVSAGPDGVLANGDDLVHYVPGPEFKAILTPSGW